MNIRKFILVCILAGAQFPVSGLYAQEKVKLTVEELFQRIEKYNTDVEAARKGVGISAEEEKSARAQRLPDIDLSASADYLGDSLSLTGISPTQHAPLCHTWAIHFRLQCISLCMPEESCLQT